MSTETCESRKTFSGKPAIVFWIMISVISLPLITSYFLNLWGLEHYQFFPFALIAIFLLARARMSGEIHGPRNAFAWWLVAISFVFTFLSILLGSPWLTAVGLVLLGIAFFYSQTGKCDSNLVSLSAPLIILIRIPLGLDQLLVIRLQKITTHLSSVFLDFFAVTHFTDANAIQLTTRELFVAEACSGIQSVFTLSFIACLFVVVNRKRLWLLPIYLGVAIIFAIAGNVLRVTAIVLADVWLGLDLAEGFAHAILGYSTLLCAIGCLWSFENLMVTIFHPTSRDRGQWEYNPLLHFFSYFVDDRQSAAIRITPDSLPLEHSQTMNLDSGLLASLIKLRIVRALVFGMFFLMFVASFTKAVELDVPGVGTGLFFADSRMFEPSEQIFDEKVSSLKIRSYEKSSGKDNPRLGSHADIWSFETEGILGQIVVSQTYRGWHELCLCYEIDNWLLLSRETFDYAPGGEGLSQENIPIAYARLRKNNQKEGYLFYTAVDFRGKAVMPPPQIGRLNSRFTGKVNASIQAVAMIQVWVTSDHKLKSNDLRDIREDFFRIRNAVSDCIEIEMQSAQITSIGVR